MRSRSPPPPQSCGGAGTRLAGYVDRISAITGMGAGFLGLLLVGGITSLPEVATVSTASLAGNAPLAINNILGSSAINIVLLAVADAFLGQRALTSTVGTPTPLLQGVVGILLLAVVVISITLGDSELVLGMGMWSMSLLPLFVFAVWLNSRYQHHRPWQVDGDLQRRREREERGRKEAHGDSPEGAIQDDDGEGQQVRPYLIKTGVAALVILASGYVLATSGDAIAVKTGIGASLVGAVLVGFSTSLPEISSIYAAVKLERFNMVLGDIFGTNIFNLVLIFLADALYSGEPVLTQAGAFEIVATMMAIVLTAIYLIGLLEREDRTVGRVGYASLAVILTYAAGLVALSRLSSGGGPA